MDRLGLFGQKCITDWKSQLRQVFSHTVVTSSVIRWIRAHSNCREIDSTIRWRPGLVLWHRFSSLSSFSVRSRDYCCWQFGNWTIDGTDSFGLSWLVLRDRLLQVLSLSGSWLHPQFFLSKLIWSGGETKRNVTSGWFIQLLAQNCFVFRLNQLCHNVIPQVLQAELWRARMVELVDIKFLL